MSIVQEELLDPENIQFNKPGKNCEQVLEIGKLIQEGASEFIKSEYEICSIFFFIMGAIIFVCVD